MEEDTYYSILTESTGTYKEKGSKFLSFAFPVETEEGINRKIEELKKKYHDARHHCYAYILGKNQVKFRANDDGEPKHSAGDPILNQIRSFNLSDTLVVVVRYFGGTKLGIPGLINAYKASARDALNNNKIITKTLTKKVMIRFQYDDMNRVQHILHGSGINVIHQQFTEYCEMTLSIRESTAESYVHKLMEIKSLRIIT